MCLEVNTKLLKLLKNTPLIIQNQFQSYKHHIRFMKNIVCSDSEQFQNHSETYI